ncbi:MAG: ABC transporter ATP-binding protein [Candidatus Saccharimonadales bacterium]
MRNIWRIIRTTKSLWRYYVAISFFTIGLAILNLLQPLFSGWAIDAVSHGASTDIGRVVFLVIAIFASDFFSNIFSNIGGYYGDQMAVRVQRILSLKYYEHLLELPQRYFDTELTGKIINRLSRSIYQIANFMNMLSNNFLQFIFSSIFALIIVTHYSWQVALMLFGLYPIYFVMTVLTSRKWKDYQKQKNESLDVSSGRFAEAIGQVKVVKSFNQEAHEIKFFRSYMNRFVDINRPQSRYWHGWDFWRRLVLAIVFLGVYLFIFIQAAHGQLTPGQAVALILYAMQIRIPLFTISFLVNNTQRALADSRDYFEAMSIEPEVTDRQGAKSLDITAGKVEFKNVEFGYDESTTVLKGLNFNLEPDSKVALVGESGEGKTTITSLLLRLYEVASGQITIDGQNINDVTQASLRRNIGVVFQEPALFSGTVRENIAYGKPTADDKTIEAAARAANAHDFITKFKKGYDTEIGERGLKLSGGQKQRLAIARALLKDAPILILDEATSSLDSRSEHEVQAALKRLMSGRTTLIIAHRLSTIQNVDQIITLRGGQVDEIGSPADLARTNGIYAQLLNLQNSPTEANEKKLKSYGIEEV